MKTYQIKEGGTKYQLAEKAEDLSLKRYAQLLEFLAYKETGVPIPSLINTLRGFVKGFDDNSKSQMLITLHNYVTGASKVTEQEEPNQLIFSLICFEDGEDQTNYDKTKAKEKLTRMNKEGLIQEQVIKIVENFLVGSPTLYAFCSTMNLVSRNS